MVHLLGVLRIQMNAFHAFDVLIDEILSHSQGFVKYLSKFF